MGGSKSIIDALKSKAFDLRAAGLIAAGTEESAAIPLLGQYKRFVIICSITAVGTDAGDTLDIYIDVSLDGTTWYNAIHFTQKAGNGAAGKEYAILDPSAPGAVVVAITSDAASGVVRPSLFGAYMRSRAVCVDADADNIFNFNVAGYGQR